MSPGSVSVRADLASLRIAVIEFPAVRTKSASCSSDTFKRFRTIRTCTRLLRSSLLRAPVNWRRYMEVSRSGFLIGDCPRSSGPRQANRPAKVCVPVDSEKIRSANSGTLEANVACYQSAFEETEMGKGILLWLLGVPIPVIILLWLLFGH